MIVKGSLRDRVNNAFEKKFVHHQTIGRVLSNAFQGKKHGKNVILWGTGGYGKSAMALEFARTALAGHEKGIFIQSVGASTREDEIWGGLDLASLREGKSIRYLLEKSFLNYDVVILEELFDLREQMLDDMKDTLWERVFRRGDTHFPMRTRMIIACTNKSPLEIAARGISQEALTQRFPFRCQVSWPSHESGDYLKMFRKQKPEFETLAPLLAEICSGVAGKGVRAVSPRLALEALEAVFNEPLSNGRTVVIPEDVSILVNMSPFDMVPDHSATIIKNALTRFGGTLELNRISVLSSALISELNGLPAKDMDRYAAIVGELRALSIKLKDVTIPGKEGEGFEQKQKLARTLHATLTNQAKGGS
jgi:hypothetical protein